MSDYERSFEEWIADLPDRFIECRNDQHRWKMLRAGWDAEMHNYKVDHRCTNCRARRERRLGREGHVLSNRYQYPDDYLAPKGVGQYDKDSRATMRLAGVTRWMFKHTDQSDDTVAQAS